MKTDQIALVYPYFRTRAPTELLFTPLGVATLAAQLQALGMNARIFDCTFSTFEQIQAALVDYDPAIIGIYCMISMRRNTFRLAEMARAALPGSLLVAGGPLPTLYPEHFSRAFDIVFRGEADLGFPTFCQEFLGRKASRRQIWAGYPLKEFPGLYLNHDGLQADNPQVHYPEGRLDSFPLPYRGDFDHAAYQAAGILKDGRKTASIITTYGCPYNCDFCSRPVFGNLFRRRKIESVLAEIDEVHRLGYDDLWIADDSFTLDPRHLKRFCEQMAGRKMTWSCLSRVTGLDRETVQLMKAGGCRRVYLGLETGSPETLRLMNKRATVEAGVEAVQLFHGAGVEVAAFFIVGYPGETLESIESTFRFALDLPLDEISFNVPFPLPGSNLFQRVSGLDMSRDWDKENEVTFVYNSEFDEAWLSSRIESTLEEFKRKKS